MRAFNKVFVISLPRHATTSMFYALADLGISIAHLGKIYKGDHEDNYDIASLSRIVEQTQAHDFKYDVLNVCDGLADFPAPAVFEHLYTAFPDSLFIHICRPIDDWLLSYEKMSKGMDVLHERNEDQRLLNSLTFFRKQLFDVESFDYEAMEAGYIRHYQKVSDFFEGKQSHFLQMNLSDLSGIKAYADLCEFLDCPQPDKPFPFRNEHSEEANKAFELTYEKINSWQLT